MADEFTDVSVEVFNHCAGSCTGCMLSPEERRALHPAMDSDSFLRVVDQLESHGRTVGCSYRPVLVFGDVPWMDLEAQRLIYAALADRGMPFGATMTLVEEREEHYSKGIEAMKSFDPTCVFDITIDPVRLELDHGYATRISWASGEAPHLHLQVLLSETVITRYAPEMLSDLLVEHVGDRHVSLGFTPTLANLSRSNYRYKVVTASDYARRFYSRTDHGRRHLANELARFDASGKYSEFLSQTFHIGPQLEVFPVAYTIFGDVILDARNGGKGLGSLRRSDLNDIVSGAAGTRLEVRNASWMDRGEFGCDSCSFRSACGFNGIGLVRKLYNSYETKVGSCYGPLNFGSEAF